MNRALSELAASCGFADAANEPLRLAFGLSCVRRVRNLLEDPRSVAGLDELQRLVDGDGDRAALAATASRLEAVASSHPGSGSLDGAAHAAVSATRAVAHAAAGRALDAASYAAYATVYAYGGYAVAEPSAFEPEFAWQVDELKRLLDLHAPPLQVQPLAPQRLADFLAFFDGDAFADNPRWRSCYCQYLHVDHRAVVWRERTAEHNRAAACQHIAASQMQGWLAYRAGRVVGWCNAAPRTMMQAFADEADEDDALIGQIGCFVVAKAQRRTGVASALLRAALAGFRAQGLRIAQGLPQRDARSDAQHHLGPLAMYLAAGFRVHRELDDGTIIVRRELT